MEIQFNFKNFEPSEQLKDYARNRFDKLGKYLKREDNAYLQVNLEVDRFRQIAELIMTADDLHISAQQESEDMYSTIDQVLDKMEAQLRKLKGKQKDRRKGKLNKSAEPETGSTEPPVAEVAEAEPSVVQTDVFEPKPMDVEEAAIQLEKSEYGFLVFFNAENNRVNVVYRRKNGDYGLIDPRM